MGAAVGRASAEPALTVWHAECLVRVRESPLRTTQDASTGRAVAHPPVARRRARCCLGRRLLRDQLITPEKRRVAEGAAACGVGVAADLGGGQQDAGLGFEKRKTKKARWDLKKNQYAGVRVPKCAGDRPDL